MAIVKLRFDLDNLEKLGYNGENIKLLHIGKILMKIYYTILKGGTESRRDKVENRAMAVSSLLEQLGHDSRLPIASDSMGRPHFPNSSHLDLSISHAAPFTAYAVGEGRVGIDLEKVSRIPHAARIAARFPLQ